jgi:protein-S-isoprenylcysteine O-methyltransferase Ste14
MLTAARAIVILSWFAVFAGWVIQWSWARTGRSESGRRVNALSMLGMLLELASFVPLLIWRDPNPPAPLLIIGAVLSIGSAALGWSAGAHLGAQLRIQAVVTEGHRLVTSGPYSLVRHPIYLSLLGFLIGTGLVFSRPVAFLMAVPLLVIGIEIRMRAEEQLLAAHFGEEFQAYRRRVAAWLPGIR